jgi:FkbM family methyltransferase
MTSYSQAGQDLWVVEKLHGKRGGYFVDCGAHDGLQFSNTVMLEREYGWTGVCIEAAKTGFEKLTANRKCHCVRAAVWGKHEMVPIRDDNMFGGVDPVHGDPVQGMTLNEILDAVKAPPVMDYLSLDIEGCELDALKILHHSQYRFLTVTVEHNSYIVGNLYRDQMREVLVNNGYRIDRADVASDGCVFEDWFTLDTELLE